VAGRLGSCLLLWLTGDGDGEMAGLALGWVLGWVWVGSGLGLCVDVSILLRGIYGEDKRVEPRSGSGSGLGIGVFILLCGVYG